MTLSSPKMTFPLAILHRSPLSVGVDGCAEAHAIVGSGPHMSRYSTMWMHKPGVAPHAFGWDMLSALFVFVRPSAWLIRDEDASRIFGTWAPLLG